MNNLRGVLLAFLMMLWAMPALAEEKAVTAFSEETGFKMSKKALDTMAIKFESISTPSPWKVSKGSLVRIKHVTGVYRRLDGWIDFVLVTVVRSQGEWVWITSPDLEKGDEIAIANTVFLRMTEADLKSESTDACAH